MEIMHEIYLRSPQEALEETFIRARVRYPWMSDRAFMYTRLMGNHGKFRYGSYKVVAKESLVGRKFDIEFWDGAVSLYFTDVVHDSKTHKSIPKES